MEKKPMMWMGKVSAWGALAAGLVWAGFNVAWATGGYPNAISILASILLLIAGYRTLRRASGGLRLLCGAWGFAAGLWAYNFPVETMDDLLEFAFVLIALAGLALTVLHKEK